MDYKKVGTLIKEKRKRFVRDTETQREYRVR